MKKVRKKQIRFKSLPYIKYFSFSLLLGMVSGLLAVFILNSTLWNTSSFNNPKKAVVTTSEGVFEIEFNKNAPQNVHNIVNLIGSGFYNNQRVYRIVPNLLVEMGDVLTRNKQIQYVWGKGMLGYYLHDEINENDKLTRGTVALVNHGPNTNGASFFIVTADEVPWLSGKHTIIGKVTKGMDTVDKIAEQPVSVFGIPDNNIIISSIKIK